MGLYRDMTTGFNKRRHKIIRQQEARFDFWNIIVWFRTVGSVFSTEQMNQRKKTRPKAHSIYQRMGEAPWGCIRKSWPEIVVMAQLPEATLRYDWMEHLMPRSMVVDRSDMVLVVGTMEDYMTVEHKVREKQLAARGYDTTSWLVYEEDYGSPTR
jgi:hypothetical protein